MVHPHDLWYDPWTIRILELGRGLQRHGHRVTLCHLPRREKPKHPPLRQAQPDDPPVYELLPRQQNFVHNFNLLYRLAQDCDVVHLQKCFAAAALPVLWVCRLQNKPCIMTGTITKQRFPESGKRFLSRLQFPLRDGTAPLCRQPELLQQSDSGSWRSAEDFRRHRCGTFLWGGCHPVLSRDAEPHYR